MLFRSVIDEFPYLVKTNAAFPSILQNAWDEILKDSNVMLILCGSLLSMMQKHALSHDSPLYGRRRIGKTTLIKEFIKDKQAFYFLATEEVESQSMKRLAGVVARVTGNSMLQRITFTDWLDLFREIAMDCAPGTQQCKACSRHPSLSIPGLPYAPASYG